MSKRTWILAALFVTAPCLLFTVLLVVVVFMASVAMIFSSEWTVENRTKHALWVTPLAMGSGSPLPLPHYSTRWPTHRNGDILIEPGGTAILIVDGWAESDSSPLGLAVKSADGEFRYHQWAHDGQYVLDDLGTLPLAHGAILDVLLRSREPVNFGVRLSAILALGLAAPAVFLRLRRDYRKLNEAL